MRLIDADEFKKNAIKRFHCDPLVTGLSDNDSDNLSFVIDEEPTVDPKGFYKRLPLLILPIAAKTLHGYVTDVVVALKDLRVLKLWAIIFARTVEQRLR